MFHAFSCQFTSQYPRFRSDILHVVHCPAIVVWSNHATTYHPHFGTYGRFSCFNKGNKLPNQHINFSVCHFSRKAKRHSTRCFSVEIYAYHIICEVRFCIPSTLIGDADNVCQIHGSILILSSSIASKSCSTILLPASMSSSTSLIR